MNSTFLSLSSERPRASSYPLSLAQLQATATPSTSLPVSLAPSSLSSVSATATTTRRPSKQSATPETKEGLSGGAIGGIVGGVVGGLALLGIAGFLLFRRRKANKSKGAHAPIASGPPSEPEEHGNPYEMNAYQQQQAGMSEAPPTEKYAHQAPAAPNSPYRDVPEVYGSPVPAQHLHEMQGSGPAEMDGSTSRRA